MIDEWFYLINLGNGDILRCPGDHRVASEHLKQIRRRHIDEHRAKTGKDPESVPWLIGVYPPWSVGGPEGKGGVFSYGYTPTLFGSIDTPPNEWTRE